MNAPDNEVKTVFGHAVEIEDATARAAYLDQACGANLQLRGEVEALLKAHQMAEGFLKTPAVRQSETFVDPSSLDGEGTLIGPYKLLEQIGEGGMGVVFMADQQQPVRRRVALKIIKPGMDTRQVLARFDAERQALALMDHPNIARAFDAGETDSGRPYFVMELVRGVPITDFCDQKNLAVHERLDLFVTVCHAVQHAHQKGIIHRDIKPSNILVTQVDGRPVPKVIDFGVAKAINQPLTQETLFTRFAEMVGTPLYMSPEQAEMTQLDIDTRSDIYSLGVLLYELLTGSTPFDKNRLKQATYDEIRRIIREEEPAKPSTRISTLGDKSAVVAAQRHVDPRRLSQLVRGDLDWIVMKALEKERSRRYETANGFAMDIERYLADEPVLACPPSAAYRFRKFARRNRATFTTATLVIAALVFGLVASVTQAIRATRAERQADARFQEAEVARTNEAAQRQIAEGQRQQAEQNLKRARQAVDQYFTRVSQSKLFDVPTLQPLRKELLEDAVRYYQTLLSDRGENPALLGDLAVADLRLAEIYHEVDRNDDAIDSLASGLELVDRLHAKYPGAKEEERRVAGFWKADRAPRGSTAMPKDPAKSQRTLMKFVSLWETLAREHPEVVAFQNDLAAVHAMLGSWQASAGEDYGSSDLTKAGAESYKKAIEIWERLSQSHPEVPEYRENLVMALNALAHRLNVAGRHAEAQNLADRELVLGEQLAVHYPNVPQYRVRLAGGLQQRGRLLAASGKRREAGNAFRQEFDLAKALFTQFPTVTEYAVLTATAAKEFLGCSNECGVDRTKWSRQELPPLVTNLTRLAANPPNDPASRHALADALTKLGDLSTLADERTTAESAFKASILLDRRLVQEHPDDLVYRWCLTNSHRYLGFALWSVPGRRGDAEQAFRDAIDIYQVLTVRAPKTRDYWHMLADTHRRLAEILVEAQRPEEAEQEFRRAIETHETAFEKLHVEPTSEEEWVASYLIFARFLESKGQSQPADEIVRRLISRIEALASAFPKNAVHREWLARVHFEVANSIRDKRIDDAQSHYRQGLAVYDALIAASGTNPEYRLQGARCQKELAWTLKWRAGRLADADREFRKALALFEKLSSEFPSNDTYRMEVGHTLWDVAWIALESGKPDEAEKQHRRAWAIFQKLAADFPHNWYWPWEQTWCDSNIAGLMQRFGRPKDAEKALRDAIDVCEKVLAGMPNDKGFRDRLGRNHFELAGVLQAEKRASDAEEQSRQAASIWRKLGADVPGEPVYRIHAIWTCTYQLGPLAEARDRTREAEQSYRTAADLLTSLPVTELVAEDRRNMTDSCYGNLVRLLKNSKQPQEATPVLREWLDLRRKTFDKILEQNPKNAGAHNNLAWTWATCAETQLRDPARAVALAKKAVELEPKQGVWWNTLGTAEYRAGDWKAAIEALKKSMELHNGGDSFDWFFVAMANRQLGHQQEARKWYDKAVKRMFLNEELWRFRAEAASLLGTGESLPSFEEATKAIKEADREWNLADAAARLGRWDEAQAAIDKAAKLAPGNHWYLFQAAPLYLRAGDVAGYRRTCRAMLERFQDTRVPEIADRTAKTCLLLPDAVPDFDRVQKLADRGVTGTEKQGNYRWFVFSKGLAEYRAGRHAEAMKWLERFGPHADGAHVDASAFAIMAMAQHRLGQMEQARAVLHRAQAIVAEKMPDPSAGRPFDGMWADWLHCHILLREAEALFGKKQSSTPPSTNAAAKVDKP